MNFELLLVVITAITGVIALVDRLVWAPKRAQAAVDEKLPWWIDYSRSLFPVFLVVLVLRSFVAEPFRIPSGSMYPTLEIGDFIVVSKFSYGIKLPVLQTKLIDIGEPERGDVVVFKYPQNPDLDYIKRVVGVPGDKIQYIDKHLIINGQPVAMRFQGVYKGRGSGAMMDGAKVYEECLPQADSCHQILLDDETRPGKSLLTPITVPAGHYFVMGDNRDHSNDSRYWGFVPARYLKGRAVLIWMSWDEGIRFDRIGKVIQ